MTPESEKYTKIGKFIFLLLELLIRPICFVYVLDMGVVERVQNFGFP